jgi:hypothetical protein
MKVQVSSKDCKGRYKDAYREKCRRKIFTIVYHISNGAIIYHFIKPLQGNIFALAIITQACDTFSILPWAKLFYPFESSLKLRPTSQGFLMNQYSNETFSFSYIIPTPDLNLSLLESTS